MHTHHNSDFALNFTKSINFLNVRRNPKQEPLFLHSSISLAFNPVAPTAL